MIANTSIVPQVEKTLRSFARKHPRRGIQWDMISHLVALIVGKGDCAR